MTAFHVAAAAMLALACLFVLPALLMAEPLGRTARRVKRDELNLDVLRDQRRELESDLQAGTIDAASYQSARLELERRVALDVQTMPSSLAQAGPRQRWLALSVALAVTAIASSAYHAVGEPRAWNAAERTAQVPRVNPAGAPPVTAAQVEAMVAGLAEKLKARPDDVKGWQMLARSYETLRRFDQAVDAYQHLLKLTPNDADVMVDYAVTLAMSSGQSLSGEPERIIKQALAIAPGNLQALALAGSAAFERQDYAKAIEAWRKILALAPPDSDIAGSITASIEKAEALSAGQSAARKSVN